MGAGGSRYSPLDQINKTNVVQLKPVIAAGGHGKLGTKLGDSVIAYSLP
jgi:glucose dehydrogenase